MKRFAAILTALCLLCSAAFAETDGGTLRVMDAWGAVDAYLARYPDRSVETISAEYSQDLGRFLTKELLLSGDWDVGYLNTMECDLAALDGAGVLMDLSGVETVSAAVGGMFAPVRSAVTADGRLLGVPVFLWGIAQQFDFPATVDIRGATFDLRAQLGFTDADAPRTFADLCSLAQRYMALPRDARRGTAFNADSIGANPCAYFLSYLVTLYAAETCDGNGRVDFDTPVFRAALTALDAMTAALKSDPKIVYGENGALCGVVNDVSGSLFNDGALLLRVGEGDNVPAQLGVLVVNAATGRKTEALDYVAAALDAMSAQEALELYAAPDYGALLVKDYNDNIASQIEQGEDQSVIDELTRLRDAGDDRYFYSREEVADYGSRVAPYLSFPHVPSIDASDAVTAYAKGKLDAEELIAALNAEAAKKAR